MRTNSVYTLFIDMYVLNLLCTLCHAYLHAHTGIAFAQRMQLAASRLEGETHSVESVTARLPVQYQGHRAQGMYDYIYSICLNNFIQLDLSYTTIYTRNIYIGTIIIYLLYHDTMHYIHSLHTIRLFTYFPLTCIPMLQRYDRQRSRHAFRLRPRPPTHYHRRNRNQ